jgi:hypothetical protein
MLHPFRLIPFLCFLFFPLKLALTSHIHIQVRFPGSSDPTELAIASEEKNYFGANHVSRHCSRGH